MTMPRWTIAILTLLTIFANLSRLSAEGVDRYIAVIAPSKALDVTPSFPGVLGAIHFQTGDRVRAGDMIAELNTRELQEALTAVTAELRAAQAQLQQSQIDVAHAEYQYTHIKRVVDKGFKPRQELEDARFARDKAHAAQARSSAVSDAAKARVDQALTRLRDAEIRAPFDGRIAVRYLDIGASASPTIPVVRLIAKDMPNVRFAIPASQSNRFAHGQRVYVDVEHLTMPLFATIRHIAPELDPAAKMIFVEATLNMTKAQLSRLYPGVAAWVSVADHNAKRSGPQ